MSLQNRTLRQYMELRNQPSLKVISEETGIQQTRVFRLLNGARMRLDEWEIFDNIINQSTTDLEILARECLNELSLVQLTEVKQIMEKKLEWKRTVDEAHKRLQQA